MKIRISKHYQLNVIRFFSSIVFILCMLFLIWAVISYFDILLYQDNGGTNHIWNVFNVFERLGAK